MRALAWRWRESQRPQRPEAGRRRPAPWRRPLQPPRVRRRRRGGASHHGPRTALSIRPTEDVDLLAQVPVRAEYYALETELRSRGFQQDMRVGAPICRWTVDEVTVDVMPTLPDVLGFSNRW